MTVFQFFKMAAVRHLGFLKVVNFNCRYGSQGQYASTCQIPSDRSKHRREMAVFRIFKMTALRQVCQLGFVLWFYHVLTTYEDYLVFFFIVQNLVRIGAVVSIIYKF